MRKLFLLSLLLFFGCENPTAPEIEMPEYTPKKYAEFRLNGSVTQSYTTYNSPRLTGYVINVGQATGYNVGVEFTAKKNGAIVGTAKGFPADLGNIYVGEIAYFEAVFFSLDYHSDYDEVRYEITWLTR